MLLESGRPLPISHADGGLDISACHIPLPLPNPHGLDPLLGGSKFREAGAVYGVVDLKFYKANKDLEVQVGVGGILPGGANHHLS